MPAQWIIEAKKRALASDDNMMIAAPSWFNANEHNNIKFVSHAREDILRLIELIENIEKYVVEAKQ